MRFFKRLLAVILGLGLLITFAVLCWSVYVFRDRNPNYGVDVSIARAQRGPAQVQVGFSKAKITPNLEHGPVYLAGFGQNRLATKVNDDIWAVATVIDDGKTRVGIVALDAIGFFHDDVIAVRNKLAESSKLNYTVICSTHNHSTPDLMGLWGSNYWTTGVSRSYRDLVVDQVAYALNEAATNLQTARVVFHEIKTPPDGLVTDTRKPHVYDPDLRVMQFIKIRTTNTIGSLVTWGNHPETPWSDNTEITADFCGVIRDGLEKEFGGTHLYINGAIGGLMTTSPSVTVRDPKTGQEVKEPGHEKSRVLGEQLLSRILPAMRRNGTGIQGSDLTWGVKARTILVPLKNKGYYLAGLLRLIERGHTGFGNIRTEVALLTLGQASFACIPGEIYPELINGGIETPSGADFPEKVFEQPPLREVMPGKIKFIFGLANDEIGYIIPKSQWDEKPPFTYEAQKGPYGEINSVGPDAAPIIHRKLKELAVGM